MQNIKIIKQMRNNCKKYIVIYKDKEDKKIRSTQLPPKVIKRDGKEMKVNSEFLDQFCKDYADDYQEVSYIEIPIELEEVIDFLKKDRTRDITRHLEALKEITNTLDEINDTVYHAISDMERDFKKQIEKEKQGDE